MMNNNIFDQNNSNENNNVISEEHVIKDENPNKQQDNFTQKVNQRFSFKVPSWKESVPNILTLSRIPLAIIICCLIIFPDHEKMNTISWVDTFNTDFISNGFFIAAAILFVVAALTDFVDGFIARRLKVISDFGKLWDPITDKILINSVLVSLTYIHSAFAWITALMISRDIIVDGIRAWKAKSGHVIPANMFGKLKTVMQIIGILYVLVFYPYQSKNYIKPTINDEWLQNATLFVALIFSLFSGGVYVINLLKIKDKKDRVNN